MILQGTYNFWLIGLSIALAMVTAFTSLDLAGRVTATEHRAKWFWLWGGALSMGLGIWAMHYVGMLAFSLPVPVVYHYPTVMVSLLAAVAASAVALFTVSRERVSAVSLVAGGAIMGGGIAAMHYTGMAAMRLPAMMEYQGPLFALSLAVAFVTAWAALVLAFRSRQEKGASRRKLASTLVMGSAIPLVHYTGMWAVRFYASAVPFNPLHTVRISWLGTLVISVTSFAALLLTIGSAFFDRILAVQSNAIDIARDGEQRFRLLADAIPQIVWTANPDGGVDYCNQRFYEITGFGKEQALGLSWKASLHPDDQAPALENWEKACLSGTYYEVEYRLRTAAGDYRWHLVRATPVRDAAGAVIKWYGTVTDIDDQMRHQEILEGQIKEHTEALMDSNTRLQTEMRERAVAQQKLNLQSERMVQDLTLRSVRATNLAKMAELLHSCAAVKDACAVVSGMAPKIFPELRGALFLFDSSRKILETAATWAECVLAAKEFKPEDCWALRTGRQHLVAARDHTAECGHAASSEHAYLCLPLLAHGEAIGVLHFQMIDPGELPPGVWQVANMFAEQVGLSVANIRLRDALRNQSIRDPLTGLYNRRYLEETMERETRRAVRSSQGLGVLMLDLDHFKKFNDTYGHEAGDLVLRETAGFLLKSVRAEDIVCRFGGEEFVVILPLAELKITQARAERIRSRLRELSVVHQGQSLGVITVSVGVAELPQHGATAKELLEAADAALYRAKKEGRDRVAVAESPQATEVEVKVEAKV